MTKHFGTCTSRSPLMLLPDGSTTAVQVEFNMGGVAPLVGDRVLWEKVDGRVVMWCDPHFVGQVVYFAGTSSTGLPLPWMVCDGRSLLRTDYPSLFAAIGTFWGAADSTHFYLPDPHNGFIMSTLTSPIGPSGAGSHTHSTPNHSHPLSGLGQALIESNAGVTAMLRQTVSGGWTDNAEFPVGTGSLPSNAQTLGVALAGNTNSGGASNTGSASHLPPYIGHVTYIKAA